MISLLIAIPAAFMSAVSVTYILTADEGFRLLTKIAYPIGVGFAAALFAVYAVLLVRRILGSRRGSDTDQAPADQTTRSS